MTALLSEALVMPVLTAHQTEVRRQEHDRPSPNRIAELMAMRDAGRTETPDGDAVDEAIQRQVALLWQARALRRERLGVADEVETTLSYLRDVFLRPRCPRSTSAGDRALGGRVPSFLKPGSWIGGDRDGNPNVTADSLTLALARAAETVIGHYLDTLHALGAELSISSLRAQVDPAVLALADASGDTAASRQDERSAAPFPASTPASPPPIRR